MLLGEEGFSAFEVPGGVEIEKPVGDRKTLRMRDLAGLNEQFERLDGEGPGEGIGCGAEGTEAIAIAGTKAGLENGESGAVDHDREGLDEAGNGDRSDRGLGYDGAMKKIVDKTSG